MAVLDLRSVVDVSAKNAGFDLCGILNLRDLHSPELDFFSQWIGAGHAGEMKYLEARNEAGELKRAAMRNALPWAQSLMVVAANYNSAQPRSLDVAYKKDRGWISRYAWSREDYHDVLLRKLRQVEAALHVAYEDGHRAEPLQTRCYVDTGPFVERIYAKYAGVGWIGKNTCLINQDLGSWLFLGVIAASIEFEGVAPQLPAPDRCGSCTRCLDACPTQAFGAPYQLDASRCISYLTIEKRGSIPPEMRPHMGNHLFGCDICQDVCPWNRKAPVGTDEFAARSELVNPPLTQFGEMTRENFQQMFRRSPVKRAKYAGLRRNAAVAMGNSRSPDFVPQLTRMAAGDEDPVVAEHARWALERLRNPRGKLSL